MRTKLFISIIVLSIAASSVIAQTNEFTYQGRLVDGTLPANASYDFEFRLFTADAGGAALATNGRPNVSVSDGIFTVRLDFGANFDGTARWLEIAVKPAGSGGGYQQLLPRQPVTSTPYSIRSLNSTAADQSTNATQLGGVAANQYVQTTDPRLSDARTPTPGSGSYIQNSNAQQTANFNVSGNGTLGGNLTVGGVLSLEIINAQTQYNLGGSRVLITSSFFGNIFAGIGAGSAVTSGGSNSFFGNQAGQSNATGGNNSFFGKSAGNSNTGGGNNSFFGESSGFGTSTGGNNSFFGGFSGRNNSTGSDNAFFGYRAGQNNTASGNSFFGSGAGDSVTTGANNSFFGRRAGASVNPASNNSFFGYNAGTVNTSDANSFFGAFAGDANTTGASNSFFGNLAGSANVTGANNAFFGFNAGAVNTASNNSFYGARAGDSNTSGFSNAFFGEEAGQANVSGDNNSFFGTFAGSFNTSSGNSFFGRSAGIVNTTGANNTFIGNGAGSTNSTGSGNTFIGNGTGSSNTGSNNIAIGNGADVDFSLSFATAIGAGVKVFVDNQIKIGRTGGLDTAYIPGRLIVEGILRLTDLSSPGLTAVCRNFQNELSTCSSSLRYKNDIQNFTNGLDTVRRLRPITFSWLDGGMKDVGFGAEEVNKVEPLLTTYNDKGEIEGVKYAQITTVLVNAVKEQQEQIDEQRRQIAEQKAMIEALRDVVCSQNPNTAACREKRHDK